MKILVLLGLLLMVLYVGLAWKKKEEIPVSVSSISYIFSKSAFSTVMSLYALLTMPQTLEKLPEDLDFIGFLSFVGIILVASSPYFRTEKKMLHNIGGFLFGILSQVVVGIINPWLLLGWVPFITYLLCKPKSEKLTFWAEATAAGTLSAALLL